MTPRLCFRLHWAIQEAEQQQQVELHAKRFKQRDVPLEYIGLIGKFFRCVSGTLIRRLQAN
jgi:hypothetical protein